MSEFHSEYGFGWFPARSTNLNPKQFEPHIYYEADPDRPTSNFGLNVAGIRMLSHDYNDPKSEEIGKFEWHKKTGEILNVDVDKAHRRKGVATSMLNAAKNISAKKGLPPVVHSNDRSDMGDKWAKSTGEELPKRLKLNRGE